MKHLFTILFFSLFVISANAQARIGWTEQEIKNEFSDNTFTSGFANNEVYYIQTRFIHSDIIYYFNDDNLCYGVVIFPITELDINYYVQNYNSKYVIISDKEWKQYFDNGNIMTINLFYEPKSGRTMFVIK